MKTRSVYCSHCDKQVDVGVTPMALSGGQATLPDGGELICLDFGAGCRNGKCPISGLPAVVMGFRLARSGEEKHGAWPLVSAVCEACGERSDMEVLDETHAFCTHCRSTNTLVLLRMDDDSYVAVAGRAEPM
ncbi:MAG: hypothetical protein R3E98_08770 [Gemmatimonadota bacterium]|nr:hypothetical protein [Gemmatimonadota bacterium]